MKFRNIILLCAGSGSRMGGLTAEVPKCLLQVNNKDLVIDYILKAIIPFTNGEIIAVAGFNAKKLKNHLSQKYGNRVRVVLNKDYEKDTNIYSVELGVLSLKNPENGYTIIETDLLLEQNIWKLIFQEVEKEHSFWVCNSYYSNTLTGGIVCSENGWINSIQYKPEFNSKYLDWHKMLGIMSVGPNEVKNDIKYRQLTIKETIKQYYLKPWSDYLSELPCKVLQTAPYFARSFNTKDEFLKTCKEFYKYQNEGIYNDK